MIRRLAIIVSLGLFLCVGQSLADSRGHVYTENSLEFTKELPIESSTQPIALGEYTITAYCSCEKCCGKWALNRPGGIVYGAYGIELVPGLSCAAPMPCGTILEIEGLGTYIVHDATADWIVERYQGKIIDLYFSEHGQAVDFGKRVLQVFSRPS